jgi:hypothetical protein
MKIKTFKALWGMQGSLDEQVERIKKAGYDGVEAAWQFSPPAEQRRLKLLLKRHRLGFIPLILADTFKEYKDLLTRSLDFNPIQVTAHSSRDSLGLLEQIEFFRGAVELERELKIDVGHETHRHRALYSPWASRPILEAVPELRLTADLSHWCCVCESMLEDAGGELQLVYERTIHIHGRVGYAEGPQVNDPRAPENFYALKAHEAWWESIKKTQKRQGRRLLTFTPEFGPPQYMHEIPYTRQPVADLWEICDWMHQRYRKKNIR